MLINEYASTNAYYEELREHAMRASEGAYVPYTKNARGAALLTVHGQIFTGATIENSSQSETLEAEKIALAKAITEGFMEEIVGLVVYAKNDEDYPYLSGSALQMFVEFTSDIDVILIKGEFGDSVKSFKLDELLPYPYIN